jgi:SIR2-like domain
MGGHLFIINGDLTKLACDAIFIPTDSRLSITDSWNGLLKGKYAQEIQKHREYPGRIWGSATAIPLSRVDNEPWIWLGKIGQPYDGGSDFSVFAPIVQQFVEKAGDQVKALDEERRVHPWPKPRLAVNVVASGHGGASDKKGELVLGLVDTLGPLAHDIDVDIILVTFGQKPYAAAQRARRKVVGRNLSAAWQFDDRANPELVAQARDLAKHAIDSQLVLFIGAGVSVGAGIPMWRDLLCEVAATHIEPKVVDLLMEKDFRDQATILERRLKLKGKDLRRAVAERLRRSKRYALPHGLLASLPSNEAITTNFDELFELASRTARRRLAVLPASPASTGGRWLLKLHGTVRDPANIVLTRSDFLNMPRRYGALMGLVQGLLMMRHMMFVGYSLRDEDFHELVHEVRVARGDHASRIGAGTVLTLKEDLLEKELWIDDLKIVPMIAGTQQEEVTDEQAARQLEMFLDLVGYLSTTSAAFFLDVTYDELSKDEEDLREDLRGLANKTHGSKRGTVGYSVRQFLESALGAADAEG